MSVGARGIFTQTYDPLLFDVSSIPFPKAGSEEGTFSALEEICARADTAALIVEPLVLGAGGMLMYPPWVLKRFRDICTTHEVLMIADEVMTGWGRTGTLFACEQAAIAPDIACYSKGLTGGALPLAVTLCTREIFMAHYAPDRRRTFFHSSSFTANPIACAAALANLEIWETDAVHARIARLELMQAEFLGRFRGAAGIENVRQTGTITAFDLETPDAGYLSVLGPRLRACFQAANVLLRPLGNTIYVLPPYCVSREDLDRIYESIDEAITAC
jgi:adenosylmethionine-8-amino-7-oxononanoate aminotransferase